MRIALYAHGGSGNHGCEALVRSAIDVIGREHEYVLLSENVEEDQHYQLDEIAELKQASRPLPTGLGRLKYLVEAKLFGSDKTYYRYRYRSVADMVAGCDLALAIGGDNYCYKGFLEQFGAMNRQIHKAGVPTVLLGCSIEPSMITDALLSDLQTYKLITARESITYNALVEHGLKNVVLCPDTAFRLAMAAETSVSDVFVPRNTVGINVSPLIIQHEGSDGMTLRNYETLVRHILDTTDMAVALIPHVVWSHNDDRKPLTVLYERFKDTGRVFIQPDGTAQQLKSVISRCRFMVAARTHASIAAYSTGVPTLVVGYSVKAHGIANDLFGTDEHYVVAVDSLREPDDLKNAFMWLQENEQRILNHYDKTMKEYIAYTQTLCSQISNAVL